MMEMWWLVGRLAAERELGEGRERPRGVWRERRVHRAALDGHDLMFSWASAAERSRHARSSTPRVHTERGSPTHRRRERSARNTSRLTAQGLETQARVVPRWKTRTLRLQGLNTIARDILWLRP